MKMMKKILVLSMISLMLVFTAITSAVQLQSDEGNEEEKQLGFIERIRNRIYDMLGYCYGGVNLTNLTGMLEYNNSVFTIGDVELHFGPVRYIESVVSNYDYDNDGTNETIFEELQGLVNLTTNVTVQGHMQSDYWMSVFSINGLVYREPDQPFWMFQYKWQKRNNENKPD